MYRTMEKKEKTIPKGNHTAKHRRAHCLPSNKHKLDCYQKLTEMQRHLERDTEPSGK